MADTNVIADSAMHSIMHLTSEQQVNSTKYYSNAQVINSTNPEPKNIECEKIVNYKNELILYFYTEMLPFIIDKWDDTCSEAPVTFEDEEISFNIKDAQEKQRRWSVYAQPSSIIKGKNSIKDNKPLEQNRVDFKNKGILSKSPIKVVDHKVSSMKVVHISKNDKVRTSVSNKLSAQLPVIEESFFMDVNSEYATDKESLSVSNEVFNWLVDSEEKHVRIKFKNGNEYIGDISRKLMHGNGTYMWSDGSQYQGEFDNGDIHGIGFFRYSDLSYYRGHFCRGLLHGQGAFYPVATTIVYSGQFKGGKRHGKGWLSYGPNEYYDGNWEFGRKNGLGYELFANKTSYKGNWSNGKMVGPGSIAFYNSDFYKGEFQNGVPHGYGEYTWNAIRSNGLACRLENTFQGEWVEGKRSGIGVMHFGMQGSKLAGVWIGNKKHGPGVLVCGNGEMYKRNPLFIDDSPIHMSLSKTITSKKTNLKSKKYSSLPATVYSSKQDMKVSPSLRFDLFTKMPKSEDMVTFLISPICSENLLSEFIAEDACKANMMFPYIEPQCNPIDIPIHGSWCQVDLSFHINNLIDAFSKMEDKDGMHNCEISKCNLVGSQSTIPCQNNLSELRMRINYDLEERKLRNVILINHDLLQNVYNQYATLTLNRVHPKFTPVLTRLFMWQMYRDFEMYKKDLSLVQIDLIMMEFDLCDLDTTSQHYPFEKIYLWQFLHLLLQICLYCYPHDLYYEKYRESGIYAKFFENFINDYIIPKAGKFEGQLLFKYTDLLPIKPVYFLYRNLGEPHSARTFLNACCVKKKEAPPPYLKDFDGEDSIIQMDNGMNILCGINLLYVPDEPAGIGEKPKERPSYPMKKDPFYKDLKLFRTLGTTKIVEFLIKVCPLISKDGVVSNMNLELTFLEFYEVLLLCACEITDKLKKTERKSLHAEYIKKMSTSITEENLSKPKHSGKSINKK